jgi:hypothetical protein
MYDVGHCRLGRRGARLSSYSDLHNLYSDV